MKAHIIVDRYRPYENVTLADEMKKQGIDYQIWSAVHDNSSVAASINRSHKIIVEYAKRERLPEVCIMEEDVWFPGPAGFRYFLQGMPAEFDLYLGGVYDLDQAAKRAAGETAIKVTTFTGLHCYIIRARYYNRFLAVPDDEHIDVAQEGKGQFFVCFPFAALQHPGWSANNRMIVDYNTPHQIPINYVYTGEA